MAKKILNSLLSAGAALSPKPLKLLAQKKHFGLNRNIKLNKLSEYARAGIHPGSKEFKIFYSAGLIDDVDADLVSQTKSYHCETIGKPLDPIVNIACKNLNGVSDSRFLPRLFYWFYLIPYLNDMSQHDTYTEKNLYTKHLPTASQPRTFLKNINGSYFDPDDKPIRSGSLASYIRTLKGEFIIKPSRTANGQGINLLTCNEGDLFLSAEGKRWDEIEGL